jgi:hypothetical protein
MARKRLFVVFFWLFLLAATGCRRIERARECRALVALVNPALEEIEQRYLVGPRDAAMFRDVAQRYETLGKQIALLSFSSPEVKASVDEYRNMVEATGKAARSVGDTLAAKNDKDLNRSKLELDRVVRREKAAVYKIDAHCHAP